MAHIQLRAILVRIFSLQPAIHLPIGRPICGLRSPFRFALHCQVSRSPNCALQARSSPQTVSRLATARPFDTFARGSSLSACPLAALPTRPSPKPLPWGSPIRLRGLANAKVAPRAGQLIAPCARLASEEKQARKRATKRRAEGAESSASVCHHQSRLAAFWGLSVGAASGRWKEPSVCAW